MTTAVEKRLKLLQEQEVSLPSRIFQFAAKDSLNPQEISQILDILDASEASTVLDIHDNKNDNKNRTRDAVRQIQITHVNGQLDDRSKITVDKIVNLFLSDNKSVSEQDSELVEKKIKTDCGSFKNNIQDIIDPIYDQNHTHHQDIIKEYGNLKNAKDNFVKFFTGEFFTTHEDKLKKIDSAKDDIVSQIDNVEGIPSMKHFIVTIRSFLNEKPSKSPEAKRPTPAEKWLGPDRERRKPHFLLNFPQKNLNPQHQDEFR